ncbi:MAG: nucleotidyltransferase domain-containing protein [Salinivirgaceae bacterium]|jgi:predicted nucleotidyltransferase|nr:nucleotidyltransferase domain-containing protein [Salinivirgaceae bacterium]
MMNSSNILNYLTLNKERLSNEYHLTKIGLFGSMARGDFNDNSDIDIIVEFEPNTSDLFTLKQRLKQEIQEKFQRQVDICRLKYIKPIFRNQIQSDIIYA